MSIWNPWRGCKKCSDGCMYCYIHKGDLKRGINTNDIIKTKDFYKPIEKKKNGDYKMKSGFVNMCFQSDFLLEDMIKTRSDCDFFFLTKRIDRFEKCMPLDIGDGYNNLIVGCTVENQKNIDYKLPIFKHLPIKHKYIILQPLLEEVNIEDYLDGIELVVVGGESDKNARVLDYNWVLSIREQCIKHDVEFSFRQCGSHFLKDGKMYNLQVRDLCKQARLANIDYHKK